MGDSKNHRPTLVAEKRIPTKGTKPGKTIRKKAGLKSKSRRNQRTSSAPRTWYGKLLKRVFSVVHLIGRLTWGFAWRFGLITAALLALGTGIQYTRLPDISELLDGRARGSVTLLDRNGRVFAWRGKQFGGAITDETVSPHLRNAIIATEDRGFYWHFGISPRGIIGAIWINLREGRGPLSGHGGSTITQQTAKLLCLGETFDPKSGLSEAQFEKNCRQGSIWRKIREAVFAVAMEFKFTKSGILTIYMNRAFLGAGAQGFEAASQRYFGISAADVNPGQAAMLAGLLVAPTRFAPTNNLERSQNRAATILRLMNEQGYLKEKEYQEARNSPAHLSSAAAAQTGGYFADWVMASGPRYFTFNTTEDVIIKTTFDQILQGAAEQAMLDVFENKVRTGSKAQAAIVVMSADGAVRAMVGGRQTKVSGAFNRATQALRQTGSLFKPFVYAAALDRGYSPLDIVLDDAFCMYISGSGNWCPRNYTKDYQGEVTLTHALKDSLNIPAIKVSEAVGRDHVRRVASEFGINRDLAQGPALALGTSESTLIEMTGAYAGILNGGSAVIPYGLLELRLLNDEAPVMGREGGIGNRVVRERTAEELIWMMQQVVAEGTGTRAAQPDGRPVAGKTGTTQAARDAWFIGFSADYVAGVWMGYDDNTPLTGVTGGGLPAEIWKETMIRVHEDLPIRQLSAQTPQQTSQFDRTINGESPNSFLGNLVREILGSGG